MRSGVLFISPRSDDAALLSRMLGSLSLHFKHVASLKQARHTIGGDPYQVILTEARLPDGNWVDVLNLAREATPSSEVIVTDRFADARFWAEALNLGAYDLIAQPFAASEVQRILSNACSRGAQTKFERAAV